MYPIVDIHELATILKASPHTLKKNWRSFPHIFIGDGKTLRGARFIVSEVIEHLKKEAGHVSVEKQKKKDMGRKVQVPRQTIQTGGIQNQIGSSGVGGSKAKGAEKSASIRAGSDKFNLLSGIDNVS
jgi:hypothetical protein